MATFANLNRATLTLACIALGACTRPSPRNPAEDSYRALKKIAGATAVGVNKANYDALLQDAAAEILIFRDLARDSSDSTVLRRYIAALETYKDAGSLWSEQIDDVKYDWIPRGRIMLMNPSFVARYKLATKEHTMPYSGSAYQTVSPESIQKIWTFAEATADSANALLVPRLRRYYR